MSFQTYGPDDLKRLLVSIDSHLTRNTQVILIGGTAALLAFKATRLTQDIDTFNSISSDLKKAYELAKADTGLNIPFSQATVADAPYNFEDRLEPYTGLSLRHLTVSVPEIHDFILMKAVRGYAHDLDVIEEISKKNKVKKNVLVERFEAEMTHAVGSHKSLNLNFAAVLSRCFGDKAAEAWAKGIA